MKKLLYLLFVITLLGCSSDDDNGSDDDNASAQTFFEKYDGIGWERVSKVGGYNTDKDHIDRVQFFDGGKNALYRGYSYNPVTGQGDGCLFQTMPIEFLNIKEDSWGYNDADEIDWNETNTFSVTDKGKILINVFSRIRENSEYNVNYTSTYLRTSLDDPCE